MAYNNYLTPNFYPQYYSGQQMPRNGSQMGFTAPPTTSENLIWVQGESAAKAYPVGSGQSVLLMDSEDSVMYIKSTDQSGMPQPLRVFDYKERTQVQNKTTVASKVTDEYVSRKEFDAFKEDVLKEINGIREEEGVG